MRPGGCLLPAGNWKNILGKQGIIYGHNSL